MLTQLVIRTVVHMVIGGQGILESDFQNIFARSCYLWLPSERLYPT